jgi:hypothetical protein
MQRWVVPAYPPLQSRRPFDVCKETLAGKFSGFSILGSLFGQTERAGFQQKEGVGHFFSNKIKCYSASHPEKQTRDIVSSPENLVLKIRGCSRSCFAVCVQVKKVNKKLIRIANPTWTRIKGWAG